MRAAPFTTWLDTVSWAGEAWGTDLWRFNCEVGPPSRWPKLFRAVRVRLQVVFCLLGVADGELAQLIKVYRGADEVRAPFHSRRSSPVADRRLSRWARAWKVPRISSSVASRRPGPC